MKAVQAIVVQIDTICDHILGPTGYSVATLREVSEALHRASARIDNDIALRVASADYRGDAS
jgi:hypothetical protein